jgi:RNA polymerase sigma-70 factor (ECF subfamily)
MDPLSRSRVSCVPRSSSAAALASTGRGTLQRSADVHGLEVLGFAEIERGSPSGRVSPAALGDSLDFQRVYEEHFDFVWRSLRLLGVADEVVEDAIQDTFSVVHRQLARFEGRSSLRTWIFAILHRVAANHRRARKRKQSPLEPFVEMAGGDAPDAHAEAVEAARLIERFCARLAPPRRALFVLAVLEEQPAAEVAATLGLPVSKVYSRVHALREGLRQALAAREVEHG